MMKKTFFILSLSFAALAVEAPPSFPGGEVTYDELAYQNPGEAELPPEFLAGGDDTSSASTTVAAPVSTPSSRPNTVINIHAYSTDYQVRGMGVTNHMNRYGTSSIEATHTFANRNLFRRGIQHRVEGMAGIIWDASCPLGEIPQFGLGYFVGKEVFPNLVVEGGYHFRRGGLEGYMARWYDRSSHRSAQDIAVRIAFNDFQKGFFGHAECGLSFYGLTGWYFDAEIGYRFTDVIRGRRIGADMEISIGASPSMSYWGEGVEGVDAYRVRVALRPFSQRNVLGRESRVQFKPWVQCAWSGDNAAKIYRHVGFGPVDHFHLSAGLDVTIKF